MIDEDDARWTDTDRETERQTDRETERERESRNAKYNTIQYQYNTSTKLVIMYEISEISTNLYKMYDYPMYCEMLGIGNNTILKKNNVWKSLVEI